MEIVTFENVVNFHLKFAVNRGMTNLWVCMVFVLPPRGPPDFRAVLPASCRCRRISLHIAGSTLKQNENIVRNNRHLK